MKKFILFVMIAGLLILGNSCNENTITDPGTGNTQNDLTVDPVVQDQASSGFQVNGYVQSMQEIEDLTATSSTNAGDVGPSYSTKMIKMASNAVHSFRAAQAQINFQPSLAKIASEITLFYEDTLDANGNKYRSAFLYDPSAGNFRFYVAIYEFAPRTIGGHQFQAKLAYDSTDVIAAGTNLDSLNDLSISNIYNLQKFKADFVVTQTESNIDVTSWSTDGQPLEFVISSVSTYNQDAQLAKVTNTFVGHADGSGVVTRVMEFKDGTKTTTTYTFGNNNSGSFTREGRDGINVTGSFDRVFDDGRGFYNATTTFPDGGYIKSIVKNAIVAYDSTTMRFDADYHELITFAADSVDSAHVVVYRDDMNGVSGMTVTRRNGAHGSFVFQNTDNLNLMTGFWVTRNSYYIDIRAEYYLDGSSYLHYKVYTNEASFSGGDDPIVDAEYNFSADQSGSGTISYQGKTYDVTLGSNGQGSILLGGKKRTIRIY